MQTGREKMMNKEMHDKFATLVMENTHDINKRLGEALDKLVVLEQIFYTKLNTKFNELLARLPPLPVPPPRPGYVGACTTCSTGARPELGSCCRCSG